MLLPYFALQVLLSSSLHLSLRPSGSVGCHVQPKHQTQPLVEPLLFDWYHVADALTLSLIASLLFPLCLAGCQVLPPAYHLPLPLVMSLPPTTVPALFGWMSHSAMPWPLPLDAFLPLGVPALLGWMPCPASTLAFASNGAPLYLLLHLLCLVGCCVLPVLWPLVIPIAPAFCFCCTNFASTRKRKKQ